MTNDIHTTLAERGTRYGAFINNATIAQGLKQIMRQAPMWDALAPDQKEALEMIQSKIARLLNKDPNYLENYRDVAGYAQLVLDRLMVTEGATDSEVTLKTNTEDGWK